jgi:hypothetical protein
VDNHLAKNWISIDVHLALDVHTITKETSFSIYPNPTHGKVFVSNIPDGSSFIEVYNLTGQNLARVKLNETGSTEVDLSGYNENMLFVRLGSQVRKVILIK